MNSQNQSLKQMTRNWQMCLLKLAVTCALSISSIAAPTRPTPDKPASPATLRDAKQAQRDKATATLFYAISIGNREIAVNALRQGANPNAMDKKGESVLYLAAWNDNAPQSEESIFEYLLRAGANPNIREKGGQPLLFAVLPQIDKAQLLLNRGAEVNATDNDGHTALHNLVYYLHTEDANGSIALPLAKMLIAAKANVNAQDHDGNTPLHFAFEPHYAQFLLENGADVKLQNNHGASPLLGILRLVQEDGIFFGVEQRADVIKTISIFLSRGVNPNVGDETGTTPLHYAASNGFTAGVFALLEGKADIAVKDKGGNTPLHSAIGTPQSTDVVQLLIEKGANVNERNGNGETPLHLVGGGFASLDTCWLLLEKGADPNAKDKDGTTPFLSVEAAGALSSAKHRALLDLLLDKGADINYQGSPWGSAFHIAAIHGSKDLAKFLISRGFKMDSKAIAQLELDLSNPRDSAAKQTNNEILQILKAAAVQPNVGTR